MATEKSTYKTVDEYIALFPEDIQTKLQKMRAIIKQNVPNDTKEIIS